MYAFCLIFLLNSLAKSLPQTKHLRGGVFSWPNALAASRKLWSSLKVPKIKFDSSDISLSELTKELVLTQIDFNLSDILQDMLNSFFSEDNCTESNETDNIVQYVYNLPIRRLLKRSKVPRYGEDENDPIDSNDPEDPENPYYPDNPYEPDRDTNETHFYCDESQYPNAYLVTDMSDGSFEFDCKTVDKVMGQAFSYAFVIAPILVIFIINLLFYIVFCFGRCCCCRPKKRYGPKMCEIIFFAIIATFMLLTIIFCFLAAGYLINIVNYVFRKKILDDAEEICQMIDPSITEGLQQTADKLIPAVENISNQTIAHIDFSLPNLISILNATKDNISELFDIMKDLKEVGDVQGPRISNREGLLNSCMLSNSCPSNGDVDIFSKFTDFNKASDSVGDLDSSMGDISGVTDLSSTVDEGKANIVDSMAELKDSIDNLTNFSMIDNCDLEKFIEWTDDIPSFAIPLGMLVILLIPIIMLIVFLVQVAAFWTKCCCSRCCANCCFPCVICSFCQFIFGIVSSVLLIAVIFINLLYKQGDDVLDTIIKDSTNEERMLDFGYIDLSSMTDGVIGKVYLDSVKLNKIEFIKNFIDAKLNTPLTSIISLDQLSINEIADMFEECLSNSSNSTNVEDKIVKPVNEAITKIRSSLPNVDLNDVANLDEMKSQIDTLGTAIGSSCGSCNAQFNNLNNEYTSFIANFNSKKSNYQSKREEVNNVLDKTSPQVREKANDLFDGLLATFGVTFASLLRQIIPAVEDFDTRWVIGAFNIIRVNFLRNFFASVAWISVTAHLYLVGMIAMTILLWVRRKGMAEKSAVGNSSEMEDDDNVDQREPKRRPFGRKAKIENDLSDFD